MTESLELSGDTQDGIFQCRWMHPPLFGVSLSRFTLRNLSATPSPSTMLDAGGLLLPPSLNALAMVQCLSLPALQFGSRQPVLPIH